MLDLAKHIVTKKSGHFEPAKFEDQYEEALTELINQKRAGVTITPKAKPVTSNVVNLMEALRRSVGQEEARPIKKPKKAAGQREMLMPIEGKKPSKDRTAKRTSSKTQRKSA
jgi:DNA end-binding protein Ku